MAGSLTVHVQDEDENPVRGKEVRCIFPADHTHSEEYTDEDGVAEFDYVPNCTVKVYVDGKMQLEVGVGPGEHEDVTVTL